MLQWFYKLSGTHNFKEFWDYVWSKEAHPFLQFCKYGFAGGIATVFSVSIFAALNETVLPSKEGLPTELRGRNFVLAQLPAFAVANLVAYYANIKLVFKGGKFGFWHEFGMFTVVSFIGFVPAIVIGYLLITGIDLNEYYAYLVSAITSLIVNYTTRKFFIFHG